LLGAGATPGASGKPRPPTRARGRRFYAGGGRGGNGFFPPPRGVRHAGPGGTGLSALMIGLTGGDKNVFPREGGRAPGAGRWGPGTGPPDGLGAVGLCFGGLGGPPPILTQKTGGAAHAGMAHGGARKRQGGARHLSTVLTGGPVGPRPAAGEEREKKVSLARAFGFPKTRGGTGWPKLSGRGMRASPRGVRRGGKGTLSGPRGPGPIFNPLGGPHLVQKGRGWGPPSAGRAGPGRSAGEDRPGAGHGPGGSRGTHLVPSRPKPGRGVPVGTGQPR